MWMRNVPWEIWMECEGWVGPSYTELVSGNGPGEVLSKANFKGTMGQLKFKSISKATVNPTVSKKEP